MSRILKKLLFLLIIIFLQLGVFAESNQSIPSNFSTYTHEGLFSISYPKDWEPAFSIIESLRQKASEYNKNTEGIDLPKEAQIVFFGGIPIGYGYNPNVSIVVVPLGNNNIDFKILEAIVEASNQEIKKQSEEYDEISNKIETIDGKQAIFSEFVARYPNFVGATHALKTTLLGEEYMWVITCTVTPPLNFYTYKDDIYAILRNLKILKSTP